MRHVEGLVRDGLPLERRDCPGDSCRCGEVPCTCTGTTPAELQMCPIGVCDPNFCADENFCQFGELAAKTFEGPDAGA